MNSYINRRDFLKFISLLPLLTTKWPASIQPVNRDLQTDSPKNILLLVFDALSASNISLYGYNRKTMPNLARFAEKSTVFHNNISGGNFTSPGTATLLTGTYPWTHRAFHLHSTVENHLIDRNIFNLLSKIGYTTLGYSHNLLVTSLLHQFREDIDVFKWTRDLCLSDDQFSDIIYPNDYNEAFAGEWLQTRGGKSNPGSLFFSLGHRILRVAHKTMHTRELGYQFPRGIPNLHNLFFILEDAIDWLMNRLLTLRQPNFVFFHVLPPHEPYTTRKDFIDIFSDGWQPKSKPESFFSENQSFESLNYDRRNYDEYIAYADSEFGRLYDFLDTTGKLDNTLIAFTSDHGELFERGIRGHVTPALYNPVIRVPLLISSPGQTQRKDIYETTSAADLLPTLLKFSGHPIPDWSEGEILPSFNEESSEEERDIFSIEAKGNPKSDPLQNTTIALHKGQFKMVYYSGYGPDVPQYELFDLKNDPDELQDISSIKKSIAQDLHDIIKDKLNKVNQPYL